MDGWTPPEVDESMMLDWSPESLGRMLRRARDVAVETRAHEAAAYAAGVAIYDIALPDWLWDRCEAEGTTPEQLVPLPSTLYRYVRFDAWTPDGGAFAETSGDPEAPRNRAERRHGRAS